MNVKEFMSANWKELADDFKLEISRALSYKGWDIPSVKMSAIKTNLKKSQKNPKNFNLDFWEVLLWLNHKNLVDCAEFIESYQDVDIFDFSWGLLPKELKEEIKNIYIDKGYSLSSLNTTWKWEEMRRKNESYQIDEIKDLDIYEFAKKYSESFFSIERAINDVENFEFETPHLEDKSIKSKKKEIESFEFENPLKFVTKIDDSAVDERFFIPMKSQTGLDLIFSEKGGLMPCSNIITIGRPGLGKTALMLDFVAHIKESDPGKRILFVSSEMNNIELTPYLKKNPKIAKLDVVFLGDFLEDNPFSLLKTLINIGWDIVLIDSFAETCSIIKEELELLYRKKMSKHDVENFLIQIMKESNQAENEKGLPTSFICIQQVTKSGDFVGSNKLKHNTTAMLELGIDEKDDGRFLQFTKNRHGDTFKKLYYRLSASGISYLNDSFEARESINDVLRDENVDNFDDDILK